MKTILVVEDTASELELIAMYLTEDGYTVIRSQDAKDALDKAIAMQPDVVLTDVVMPGMSGFELCRTLKKNETTKQLPVVVCTSKNQELDRLWGMKQGVDVYITKPFSRDELIRAVKSVA